MKRALRSAFVCSVLVACGGETPAPQPPPAPSASAPPPPPVATSAAPPPAPEPPPKKPLAELQRAAGKTYAEGMETGDPKKVAGIFTPDAVVKMPGMPDVRGRDTIEKHMGALMKSLTKIKLGEQRVFVKNDVVVSEFTMTATHTGDFMGHKASDKPVGWLGASVAWFDDDGLVKEYHLYWNPAVIPFQIGASKEKNRGVPALPGRTEVVTAAGEGAAADVLKQLNAAWEKKNAAAFGKLLADDVEWDDVTMPETNKGKAAVLKYFKALNAGFSDIKVATLNEWSFGDYVVEEGTFSGTNTGPLFGAPPTKKPATIHELSVMKVDKDKKVVRAVTYGNDFELTSKLAPAKK